MNNGLATLKVLETQLESRDPKPADEADLERLKRAIEQLSDDSWVVDGLAKVSLDWHGEAAAEAAGVSAPAKPLSFTAAITLLVDGFTALVA